MLGFASGYYVLIVIFESESFYIAQDDLEFEIILS